MIRIYRHGDHAAIAEVFSRAIHEIAIEHYSREQCLAWSSCKPNPEHWKKRCELKRPFIAEIDHQTAGFLELDTDGHIDCAYVSPDYQRRGVMTELIRHAIKCCFEMGMDCVRVEASLCLKPLLDRMGFSTESQQIVEINGQSLKNFRMSLPNPRSRTRSRR